MSNLSDRLPYDFDLCYDIKDKRDLLREYSWAINKVITLNRLIEDHKVDMGDLLIRRFEGAD